MAKKASKSKASNKKATKNAKPLKKVLVKKKPAKSKPAPKKKIIAKVAKKKVVTKKTATKKVVPKKTSKPVKATVIKKTVLKKESIKKSSEPKKTLEKPAIVIATQNQKPIVYNASAKAKTLTRKKQESSIDMDDDGETSTSGESKPMLIKPQIRRPDPNQPKPFIGNDTRTRYADAELKEFKEIILQKLEEAKKDYDLLKNTLAHKDDHGTDDTSPTFKLLEDGSEVMSREEINHLAARQEKFIQSLQNALVRIENKTYGICRVTGKLIPKERLRVVPHATLSIDAKLEQSTD